jgi:hypothetical protein
MTMTTYERETLQRFTARPHEGLYEIVAILAEVALKQEAARVAQSLPSPTSAAQPRRTDLPGRRECDAPRG